MKTLFISVLILSTFSFCSAQPTIFWSENFNQTASTCNPDDAPFNWHVTEIGLQGSNANYWYIDTTVDCHSADICFIRDTSQINRALYISYGDTCDSALYGPVYKKGCDNTTDKRVESPTIDCSGKSNILLEFDYMARKMQEFDFGKLWYSENGGSTWDSLSLALYSGYCPILGPLGGFWKHYSVNLPTSANNNPDVKIGFRWKNNDDCLGTFVSIAVDNITLSTECNAGFTVSEDSICPGSCTQFTFTGLEYDSLIWYFPGGNPATSDTSTISVCYNLPGQYSVSLVIFNDNCFDSSGVSNFITAFSYPPPQGISQNGDTLFAYTGATSYQWYYNGVTISGATDYFYIAICGGNYNVVATDSNECEVEAAIFDVVGDNISPHIVWATSQFEVDNSSSFPGATFDWWLDGSPPSNVQSGTSSTYSPTVAGIYYVTVSPCHSNLLAYP